MPWKTPAPRFAIPWATDSWFTSMRYRWRVANALRVAGRLREPDEQQRDGRDDDLREVPRDEVQRRDWGSGRPARHRPNERDTVSAQVEDGTDAIRPPTTSTSAPGTWAA